MKLDRRQVLGLTAGAAVLVISGIKIDPASAAAESRGLILGAGRPCRGLGSMGPWPVRNHNMHAL